MRAFKRDVTDSSFNMEAVSMNNVTFLYGGVPSLTRQLSALFPFLLTYLFFFSPLFSLFIFALFNSVCESWKDKFHMPWYRRKYFHNWICLHWLVDVKKKKKIQSEYLWSCHYEWKRKNWRKGLCWKEGRYVSDLHIVVLKMWVKCDVVPLPSHDSTLKFIDVTVTHLYSL